MASDLLERKYLKVNFGEKQYMKGTKAERYFIKASKTKVICRRKFGMTEFSSASDSIVALSAGERTRNLFITEIHPTFGSRNIPRSQLLGLKSKCYDDFVVRNVTFYTVSLNLTLDSRTREAHHLIQQHSEVIRFCVPSCSSQLRTV